VGRAAELDASVENDPSATLPGRPAPLISDYQYASVSSLEPVQSLGEALRRREFVTLLGGAAFVYPFAARAQPSDQLRRVAVLGPTPALWGVWLAGFAERLRELGWIEERTIAIEYRWSEGRSERVAEAAADFVRQKPDAIVTYGGAVPAFKQATTSIPIVFAIAVDPLGFGLVDNLSHPGGNVTGLSVQQNDTTGKRLELLHDIVPGLRRLAVMFDGGYRASIRGEWPGAGHGAHAWA
jgi:putative ABC transport system substrate-binding protein